MRQLHILLVEDNAGDIFLIREALRECAAVHEVSIARDGMQAINTLNKNAAFSKEYLPDLIFLDINLPVKNGFEVLQFIKSSEQLKHIPVLMLSTSSAEKDILNAYSNHASCFITKPFEYEGLQKIIASIDNFWFTEAMLPR